MLLKLLCAVILLECGGQWMGGPTGRGPRVGGLVAAYGEYDGDDDIGSDFYEKYNAEDMLPRGIGWSSHEEPAQRVRRFENHSDDDRTLSPEELQEVRGALKQLFSGPNVDNLFISSTTTEDDDVTSPTIEYVHDEATSKKTDYHDYKEVMATRSRSPLQFSTAVTLEFNPREEQDYFDYYDVLRAKAQTVNLFEVPTTKATTTTTKASTTTTKATTTTTKARTTTTKARTTTTKAPTTTTKFPRLDIPALLDIIANLTYDYETNLTRWVNESLQRYSIPTCATPTTTTTTPTTTPTTTFGYDYEANGTGVIMGKCYVCGLEVEEIPRTAYCADAFAGDFLPLVPVNPVARGQIGTYRKYCRYMDVGHYHVNESDPRSVWGRWTGGCSVRWIDLSGIYTQRACRNRHKAVLGRHFVSKRMAKLEMALTHVDNGCIISPAASLVPLSRGISLYARFHACVCTGSWCNRALKNAQWTWYNIAVSSLAVYLCTG